MKIDSILNCIDSNKRVLSIGFVVIIMAVVGVMGYSIGVGKQAQISTRALLESSPGATQKVLGERVAPFYVNPFDEIDLKEVVFPVAQLRGCRNFSECSILCSKPANFQACAAWSKSVE